jgi:hypothetical protein
MFRPRGDALVYFIKLGLERNISIMSRLIRGLLLTIGFYSFLACAYVVARVVLHDIDPGDMFIDGIPISFWALGIATFAIGVLCVLASLISVSVDRRSRSEQGEGATARPLTYRGMVMR